VKRSGPLGPHHVQVVLSSGYQLVIPEWMLDEERCQGMEIVEHHIVALSALLALRSLLDVQPPVSSGLGPVVSEASSPGGATCESTTPGSLSVGDLQHAEVSGDNRSTLSGTAQSYAARDRKRNNRGGE
jgi:hypothetical protein